MADANRIISLESLLPSSPRSSRHQFLNTRYVRVKPPLDYDDGVRVHWRAELIEDDEGIDRQKIPCESVFEYIGGNMVRRVTQWIDKYFGALFELPKYNDDAAYHNIHSRET
ncbi:hypothetical protein LIER_38359 [Lithospermum erythrorhizon]|uniref:Uncharacterized protein n=1 Tax=Lithospermum erythrorhizon TaxID=34254 RepID=A0AAV3Q2M1_LITER